MTYNYSAKTLKITLFVFLIFGVMNTVISGNHPEMYFVLIPYSTVILIALCVNLKFKIAEDSMISTVNILKFTIFKKEVSYKQIKQIEFKGAGGKRRGAIVRNNKGFIFIITNKFPTEVFNDLIDFAERYNIPISKTKEYLFLEKLN